MEMPQNKHAEVSVCQQECGSEEELAIPKSVVCAMESFFY